MAIEKSWPAVPPRLFTADGGQFGLVTITDTSGFKVKQKVNIQSVGLPALELQVKRVISRTQLLIGVVGTPLMGAKSQSNLTAFTVLDGAFIFAGEQPKSNLKPDDILQAIYDQEPAVAIRTVPVDQHGNYIDTTVGTDGKTRLLVDSGGGSSGGGGGLAPSAFDNVKIVKNSDGDPIQYQFFLAGVSVGNIDVTYDSFGASEYRKV